MADEDPTLSNPQMVAKLGETIYAEKYRTEYEKNYPGWFVLIDVTTGEAYRSENTADAVREAMEKAPRGVFHLIRVGEPGAFKVSYRRGHAEPAWLLR